MCRNTRGDMKPYISVILPCYNVAELLPECMESLEKQTIGIENLELIFVDDASTDDGKTWNCILEFERKYPENVIAIHLDQNRCQGGARNEGLRHASADYIGFVDSDDWIEPQMYERLYENILRYGCDVVDCRSVINALCGIQYEREDIGNSFVSFERSIMEGGAHWIDAFCIGEYGGGIYTGLYRRSIIIDNDVFFPEHLKYEDNYWIFIMELYVKSWYHMSDNLYHYRENSGSTLYKKNQSYHLDRLTIEELKLQKYKELKIYDRYLREIERDFLLMYYCYTVCILWDKFDVPPYDVFCHMCTRVKELFPDYRTNPYILKQEFNKLLIDLIDRNLSEVQFYAVGKDINEFLGR